MPDQGNLYQKLILTAKSALDAGRGLPDSISALAALAEVKEQDALTCFKSIDDLRHGLVYHSVVLLNDALRRGMINAPTERPDEQLRSLARSYGEWGEANPSLFRLLVDGLNSPFPDDGVLHRFTMSMRDLFQRKLNEMRDIGLLAQDTDIARLILMLHCFAKGANIVLLTRGSDPWLREDQLTRPYVAADIFDDFLDCVLETNAPKPKPRNRSKETVH